MDAQAKLVRYLQRGLKQGLAAVARRDQYSGFRVLSTGCFLLAWVTIGGRPVEAQQLQPLPAQSAAYSSAYDGYYPQGNGAPYAELVPGHAQSSQRSLNGLFGAVSKHLPNSWVRLEYLNARIGHRSGGPLGTSITDLNGNIVDIDESFDLPIFDLINVPPLPLSVPAIAATSDGVDWDNMGGIRGSFGIPLDENSWVEGTFMGLEDQSRSLIAPTVPPSSLVPLHGIDPIQAIVIPYTIDGQLGVLTDPTGLTPLAVSPLVVFDAGFFSDYRVNLWSAEVNHIYNLRLPYDGWTLQSLLGYRHEEYSEQLTFGGSFDNRSGYATDGVVNAGQFTTPITSRYDSKVHNYRNALQFGFRSEIKQSRLTVGIEPKVALGLGLIRSSFSSSNAREPGDLSGIVNVADPNLIIDDPESTSDFDRELEFAPSAELNVYAKYDVTSWLRLKVGYNLMWLGRVGAADNSIRFNTTSAADPTLTPDTLDFGTDQSLVNRYVTGITIGGEIIFP